MKIVIHKEEMLDLSKQLKDIALQLESVTSIFSQQIIEDVNFSGEMVDAYQRYLQELMKEHKKMIQFYQALSKDMNEIVKDYDDIENLLNKRLENL